MWSSVVIVQMLRLEAREEGTARGSPRCLPRLHTVPILWCLGGGRWWNTHIQGLKWPVLSYKWAFLQKGSPPNVNIIT